MAFSQLAVENLVQFLLTAKPMLENNQSQFANYLYNVCAKHRVNPQGWQVNNWEVTSDYEMKITKENLAYLIQYDAASHYDVPDAETLLRKIAEFLAQPGVKKFLKQYNVNADSVAQQLLEVQQQRKQQTAILPEHIANHRFQAVKKEKPKTSLFNKKKNNKEKKSDQCVSQKPTKK